MTDGFQPIFPIAEAEAMVQKFLEGTLPASEFSHEAHLITGLFMLAEYGGQALPLLRKKLMDFLAAAGLPNTDTSGYHETMTQFWLWFLQKKLADENGHLAWDQATLDNLLCDEILADRNIWLEFYSKERMMSVEARRGFVKPDLKVMETA